MRKVSGKNAGKPALEFFQRGFLNLRGTDETQTAGSNPRTGRKKKIVRAASVLACIVAFTTTYALILPAVTLERQPVCGQEEHIHTDACYAYLDANGATVDPEEAAALSAAGDPDTDAESTEATLSFGSRGGYFEGVESNVKTETGADGIADDSLAADQIGDSSADVSVEASTELSGNPTQGLFELTNGNDRPVAVLAGDAGAAPDTNSVKSDAGDAADDAMEAKADAGDSNAVNAANAGSVNSAMLNSGTSLEVGGKPDMVRTNDAPADAVDTANAGSAVDAVTDPADTPMPDATTDASGIENTGATGNPVTDSAALTENAGTDASSPENPETTGTPDATENPGSNPAADGSESPATDSESETTTPSVADTAQSVRRVLICGQEEHQHTVECYPSKSESSSSDSTGKISPKSVLTGLFGYDHSQSVTVDGTTITAEYNDGILPNDVTMQAVPVAADAYVGAVADAVGRENTEIKTFDITFLSGDQEIEPSGEVKITFQADFIDPATDPAIVHITDDGSADLLNAKISDDTITLKTDSFSVYAISYTVDFHYEVDGKTYDFSIPGGGFVSFTDLVEVLGIAGQDVQEDFVSNIASIDFSDESLIKIAQVTEDITALELKEQLGVEPEYSAGLTEAEIAENLAQKFTAPDWVLVSLRAFETEDTLTVTMKNGDQFVVRVTDAAVEKLSDIVSGVSYLIYTGSGDNCYVLKADGTTVKMSESQLADLDNSCKWRISWKESNSGEYYYFRPVNNGSVLLNLDYYENGGNHHELVKSGDSKVRVTPSGNSFILDTAWGGKLTLSNGTFVSLNYGNGTPVIIERDPVKYTVRTDNVSMGTVNNKTSFVGTANSNGRNSAEIKAEPGNGYLFDYWDLNGRRITNGASIPAGSLEMTNGSILTAHFKVNENQKSEDAKPGRIVNKDYLDAWLQDLVHREFPLNREGTTKTAKVKDYENRIYQVDITSKSNVSTFNGDVNLAFIIDVSGSMLFPSKLNKVAGKENVQLTHLNDNATSKASLDQSKAYYIIADEKGTSTVYRLWFVNDTDPNNTQYPDGYWKACDASEYQLGHTDQEFRIGWGTKFSNDEADEYYQIYEDGDSGRTRQYYLQHSLDAAIKDLKDASVKLSLAEEGKSPKINVAWNTFAENVYRSEDFTSVSPSSQVGPSGSDLTTHWYTSTDRALNDAANNFNWNNISGDQKYAILITDGAPQRNGLAVSSSDVQSAANNLKSKANLISVGLSMSDVIVGSNLLDSISSTDENGSLFYRAESGDELEYIIREIIRKIMVDAIVVGDVQDEIDPAFYPVDQNGNALADGAKINLDGTLYTTADETEGKPYGTITKTGDTYTVTWSDQDMPWEGWRGSVLVKAKENFLGGNTISTNKNASITPKGYKVNEDAETINFIKAEHTEDPSKKNLTSTVTLDTPYVNVDELRFTENHTEVTVKLGETVYSLEAVKALYDRIEVSEVVTLSDDSHRNIGELDPGHTNSETYMLSDLIPITDAEWEEMLKKDPSEWVITAPYKTYGHETGQIEIRLTELLVSDEQGASDEAKGDGSSVGHNTTVEGAGVEQYTLTVTYIPKAAAPDKKEDPDNPDAVDYHTTPGGDKGQVTDSIISRNTHVVNVGDVDIPVEKTWEGNKALLDASASVKLTLGRYKLVEDTEGGTGTIILGKSLDGISRSDFDATYTITGSDGSSQTYSFGDLTKVIGGLTPGEYTITETNATAPQEGYQANHGTQTRTVKVEKDKTIRVVFSSTYTEKPGTLEIEHLFLGDFKTAPEGFQADYTITGPDGMTLSWPVQAQTVKPGTYVITENITNHGEKGTLNVAESARNVTVEVPRGGSAKATFSTTYSREPGILSVQHYFKDQDNHDLPDPDGWKVSYTVTGPQEVTLNEPGDSAPVAPGTYYVTEAVTNRGTEAGYEFVSESERTVTVEVPEGENGTATFTTTYKELPGTLNIQHIFAGELTSMPSGWTVTYTVTGPQEVSTPSASQQVKAGTYTVTETITNEGDHEGYRVHESSRTVTVEVPKGGEATAEFTSTYESEKKIAIKVFTGKYNVEAPGNTYSISSGADVTLVVKSKGTPVVKYWRRGGENISDPDNVGSYDQNGATTISSTSKTDPDANGLTTFTYVLNGITMDTWFGVTTQYHDDSGSVAVMSQNTKLTPNTNKAPARLLVSSDSLPQSNDLSKSLSMLAAGSTSSPNVNPSDANDQAVSTDTFTGISLALAQTSPTLPAAPAGMKYVLDDSYEGAEATLDASKDWKDVIKDQDWANDLGDYIYFIAAVDESNMPVGTTSSIVNETAQNAETVNTLTVTNVLPSVGNLKIEKHVTGTNTADKEFTFTITLQAPEGMTFAEKYPAKKNGLATSAASLNRTEDKTQATVTVTLKADETYEIDQFPEGTTYSVTETRLPAGYTEASHQGSSGSITRDSTVTATMNNTYHAEGDVIFKAKKIFTNGILGTPDFTFRLTQVTGDQSEIQATEKVILASPATASTTATSGITQIVDITFAVDSTHAETGEYWFMLEEVLPEDLDNDNISGNIKYDTHKKWIKVTVTDDGEGHLVVTKDPSVEEGTADDTWTNEQLTSLKVDKVWSNDDDATSIQVRGVAKNTNGVVMQTTDYVTLNGSEQPEWTYTWNKLPKSVSGRAVIWTVEEQPIDGFADPAIVEITGSDKTDGVDSEYEIINTKSTVEKMETSISVIKKWDGITDDTKDPVTVKLQQATVHTTDPLVTVTVNGISRSTYVNKGGSITYTLTGKHSNQNYVVTATTGTISDDQIEVERGLYSDKDMQNCLIIKNITENLAVTIAPNVNQTILAGSGTLKDYDRPTHFDAANLTDSDYADYPSGTDVKTATLSNENGWSAVFDKLPFRGGTDSDTFYVYRVKETTVLDGYVTEYIPEAGMYSGTIVVNNKSETVSISGKKTWIDKTQNHDNVHDVSLTLKRTAKPASETSEWETVAGVSPVWDGDTYTFTDLPKYDAEKKEYVYKAEESSVNVDGKIYTSSADGNDFTNTETVNIEATKTWKQGEEAVNATITNASAKFELQRKSGENWIKVEQSGLTNPVTMAVGNTADTEAWKAVWNGIPKYELVGGEVTEIEYRVVENSADVLGDNVKPNDAPTANVTEGRANIDNTLLEIDMSVTKQWKDDSGVAKEFDEDKSIGFTLYQKAGTSVAMIYTSYGTEGKGTVTYDKVAKKWQKITISGLPKYAYDTTAKAWVKAAYYVVEDSASDVAVTYKRGEEEAVNGAGNASVTGDSSNKTITIINQDCVTSIKIVKVDKDDNTVHLEGASFELYKKQEEIYVKYLKNAFPESPYERSSELTIEDKNDGITFTGLTDGDYQIKETKSPGGYVLTEDVLIEFTVTEGVVTDKSGNKPFVVQYDETKEADPATYTISNEKGASLPSTGGSGTTLFTVLGSILVMLSGVGLILWRRRRFMSAR